MKLKEAQAILKDEEDNGDYKNPPEIKCGVLEGMKIIAESLKDEDYIDTSAEHDVFYYGDFEKTVANLTEEQIRYLARLGWGEEYDCWYHFV